MLSRQSTLRFPSVGTRFSTLGELRKLRIVLCTSTFHAGAFPLPFLDGVGVIFSRGTYRCLPVLLRRRPIFPRDVLGRYICNGLDEAMQSADPTIRPDARPFSVIVIGGGTFGSVFAEHVFAQDKNRTRRVLVLEAGPYMLPEHTQDLPALGLNPPPATSIADLRASGQDKQARAAVWGLPWHSKDALFTGLAYCLGGRSLFWGGWSPWPLDAEFTGFPTDVVHDLQTTYLAQAADQVGSSETNDFIHGPLHEALRKQLFEGIGAGIVKEAVPLAEIPCASEFGLAR